MSRPAPEPTVVWDARGTPRSSRFGDIYRNQGLDGQGGLAQCRHVFLQGCGLLGPQALWRDQPHWTLLETGFGLGLNFLATWAAWRADPRRPRHLHFVSVEAFPVSAPDIIRSVSLWPELQPLAASLTEHWWGLVDGLHRLDLDEGQVHLTLGIGSAEQRLPQLDLQADSVFLDGFSPDVNPDLWSPAVLSQVATHCRAGTRLSTWSVTRPVRETLTSLGFQVERVKGLSPKRHALTARYQPSPPPTPTSSTAIPLAPFIANDAKQSTSLPPTPHKPPRCAIIGAGLAGAAVAHALAERGWTVDVFESGPSACSGASGLPAGLCAPHVSQDDSWLSRLTRAGVRATRSQVQRLLMPEHDFGTTGVLERRLPRKTRKARLPVNWPVAGQAWSRAATAQECDRTFNHTPLPPDEPTPLWHPSGLWLKPARLVQAQLSHPNIRLHLNAQVENLQPASTLGGWHLRPTKAQVGGLFDHVVLCAGPGTRPLLADLLPAERLPVLTPVRGQLSWGRVDAALDKVLPASPVNGDGSFLGPIPDTHGECWMAGSTFDRTRHSAVLDAQDQRENLARLKGLLPDVSSALEPHQSTGQILAWAGVRCTTPDRLPRVGALWPEQLPGLHVLTGLGARGLTLSVLCGQLLAARLCHEPLPLEPDLANRLMANRP